MNEQILEKMQKMRLHGMARIFQNSLEKSGLKLLTPDEMVAHLVEAEWDDRYNRKLDRSLHRAHFRYKAAIEQIAFEENRAYMDAAYRTPGTPLERLQVAANGYFRFAMERPTAFRLLADPPNDPEALLRVSELVRHQNGKMEAAISDGLADGSIDPGVDAYLATISLWAAANGILSLAWRADSAPIEAQMMERLWAQWMAIVIKGLYPK